MRYCPSTWFAHLQERLQARAPLRLGDVPVAAADGLLRLERVEQPAYLVDIDPGVPDLQEPHRGIVRHLGAIAAHGQTRRGAGLAVTEAIVPRGDREARRQALDVPVERRRKRLIEVVDVEDQPPVRRGEHAEIQQVRVTAGLHPDVGLRACARDPMPSALPRRGSTRTARQPSARTGSVSDPVPGCWPAPREWRPGFRPVLRRRPLRMARAVHQPAPFAPPGAPLLRREHLMRRGQDTRRHLAHEAIAPR